MTNDKIDFLVATKIMGWVPVRGDWWPGAVNPGKFACTDAEADGWAHPYDDGGIAMPDGKTYCSVARHEFRPSRDIQSAWHVVEKMKSTAWLVAIGDNREADWMVRFKRRALPGLEPAEGGAIDRRETRAICLAALGDPGSSAAIKGTDVVAAMGGISLRGTAMGGNWRNGVENHSIVELQDKDDYLYVGGQSVEFTAPKARVLAMKRVVAAFFNAIAKARVEGFNEGRNLLTGLARGEVTLESFSEQADNARVGKKPKKRWQD